jgi:hypothetical protein
MPCVSRLRRHVSFVQVIEGELDCGHKRHCERSIMDHLNAAHISPEGVFITEEGCAFIIDGRDAARFASAIDDLNVAVKVHERCARVALTRTATDWPLPPAGRILEAFENAGIDVVHLSGDASALTVIVNESQADRVAGVFSCFYQPASRSVA